MKKAQEGIVIETKGKIAIVKISRHGDCENCGSCAGGNAAILEMNNQIGANKGDKVVFEPIEKGTLGPAFMIFCLPILFIFLGSQAGVWLGSQLHAVNNLYQVLGGITAFVLSLIIIVLYERQMKSNLNRLPKITQAVRIM